MAGRKAKSELEQKHDKEVRHIFSQQFKKACQKKFFNGKDKEVTNKELFRIYEYLEQESSSLCLTSADRNNVVNTMRKWLKGETIPEYYTMIRLCEKDCLNCSLDYLLGRIECTTHNIQFIHDETGLSEDAIKQLSFLYHSEPDEFRNNVASLSYLLEHISFSNVLLQQITIFLFKYWDHKKGEELRKDEQKRRAQRTDIEQIKLEMFGYKPLMTGDELGELNERKEVALFHATNTFSSALTNIAENLYKFFQEGEKTPLVNQAREGCQYFNLPQSKD
ncbi:MAG: hypothetical protein HFG49_16500 [Lachnospiraceae bacterium]|jgi:hypothetical protein|nr:hypothetical protein [Lachnospiraceae bacterium]